MRTKRILPLGIGQFGVNSILLNLLFIISCFVFNGCDSSSIDSISNDTIVVQENNIGGDECTPGNSNNPIDSVGQIHNVLVALAESVAGSEASEERVMEVVDSLLIDRFGSSVSNLLVGIEFAEEIVDSIDEDMLETFILELNLPSFDREILADLFTILFTYDGTNVCDIIDDVKSQDDSLMNLYSENSLRYYLITASIGRYALHHWDDRFDAETELNMVYVRKGFWKKLFIGIVDAAGAIAGGLAGGPTAAGNVAGAIVGAVGASTGAAKLWDVFASP